MRGKSVKILHARKQILVFFMPGFLLGILYVNIFAKQTITETQIFSAYFLTQYAMTDVAQREYLLYLIRVRIVPFVIAVALTFTKVRKISAAVIVLWTGFSSGILLSLAVLDMRIKGILFCIIGIFPHFLFYIASYAVILLYSWRYPRNQWNQQKSVFIVLMMAVGIMLEGYISPKLIKIFLKVL